MYIWLTLALLLVAGTAGAFTTDSQEDICATAPVVLCENFENRSTGVATSTITASKYKNPGWAVSPDSSMSVVTAQAFDGTKSLQWTLPAGSGGAGYFDAVLAARSNYYVRFYMKNESNWVWSSDGNKMVYIGGGATHADNLMFDQGVFSGSVPAFIGQNGSSATQFRFPNTGGGYSWQNNQWVCVEFHPTMNSTPSATDGRFDGWIGTGANAQKFAYTGLNLDTTQTTFDHFKFSAYWNVGGTHPTMKRWIDNIVVSTQRIGCQGAAPPPSDTVPPSPVTALAAVASGSQVTLTWVNGADGGTGVQGQNIRRCTGVSCTPSALMTSLTGTNTSHVDTTVSQGTVYGYSVNDFDGANPANQGAYSSTVYVTTPTTFRNILGSDLFNRADNLDLGALWDAGYTGVNPLALVSNQLRVSATNLDSTETWNAVSLPNDQFMQCTISQVGGSGLRAPGSILRASNPGNLDAYDFRILLPNTTRLGEWVGNSFAELTSTTSYTWAAGDKWRAEVEGTTLRMYGIRGTAETLILSTTDATRTSGKPGLIHYVATGSPADVQIDDCFFGSITATPAVAPTIATMTSVTRTQLTMTYGPTAPTSIRFLTGANGAIGEVVQVSDIPGGVYTYSATIANGLTNYICGVPRDAQGVEVTGSQLCATPPALPAVDTTPIVMTLTLPNGTKPAGSTTALMAATLNKVGTCKWHTTDTTYALMANDMTVLSLTASGTATGLSAGTVNRYVRCNFTNSVGTEIPNTSSLVIPITIAAAPIGDTTPPTAPTNLVSTALSQSQVELVYGISTDASGIKEYRAKMAVGAGNTDYVLVGQPTLLTTIIANTPQNSVVNFVVEAVDNVNLVSDPSNVATVTTSPILDVEVPSTMTNLRLVAPFTNSVLLTSDPGTDNSGSVTTTIEISPAGCADFSLVYTNLALTHFIDRLEPNTSLCARGKFADAAGNVSSAYSNVLTFTTAAVATPGTAQPLSQPRQPAVPRSPRTH